MIAAQSGEPHSAVHYTLFLIGTVTCTLPQCFSDLSITATTTCKPEAIAGQHSTGAHVHKQLQVPVKVNIFTVDYLVPSTVFVFEHSLLPSHVAKTIKFHSYGTSQDQRGR